MLEKTNAVKTSKTRCDILLIPSAGLLPIIERAETGDREAMQVACSIYDWIEATSSPRCVSCSASFGSEQTGGWVVVIPASFDTEPTAVVGACRQCIGRSDLLSRALALLEAEADIVVEPDCAGRA
jgi:hypothetical protein